MAVFFLQIIFASSGFLLRSHYVAFKKARKNSTIYLNFFISKWLSDTLATGMVMHRRQQRVFNRCHRYKHWGEDRMHIVVCWDIRAKMVWQHQMDQLTTMLTKENTAPEIQHFLLQGLQDFHKHPRRYVIQPSAWKAEIGQIGWLNNTLSGFFGISIIQ